MYKVKIYGAGSIGNHLGHAARVLNWEVDICDIDKKALDRTRHEIYPARYGSWDEGINLYTSDAAPRGGYDLVFVGTPPDSHVDLAISAIQEGAKAVLLEKPVCGPGRERVKELSDLAAAKNVHTFVGYDHVVGDATKKVEEIAGSGALGDIQTLDVEFREYWGGIFAAHPWLDGPADSYLGYWQRGGGAAGEHSHAINLWQHLAHIIGAGRVTRVNADAEYYSDGTVEYDKMCMMNLTTENGLLGRVIQDVVTAPPRKWGRIQGSKGFVEWNFGIKPGLDQVIWNIDNKGEEVFDVQKTRPDDFIAELRHIEGVLSGSIGKSPISLERGLDTMAVISAAHQSAREQRSIETNYIHN
jgi:predicted dehydrogenase